jgi:hypothetical protein
VAHALLRAASTLVSTLGVPGRRNVEKNLDAPGVRAPRFPMRSYSCARPYRELAKKLPDKLLYRDDSVHLILVAQLTGFCGSGGHACSRHLSGAPQEQPIAATNSRTAELSALDDQQWASARGEAPARSPSEGRVTRLANRRVTDFRGSCKIPPNSVFRHFASGGSLQVQESAAMAFRQKSFSVEVG